MISNERARITLFTDFNETLCIVKQLRKSRVPSFVCYPAREIFVRPFIRVTLLRIEALSIVSMEFAWYWKMDDTKQHRFFLIY